MKKVLIADDSHTLRTALQLGLKKYEEEFQVIYAEDGLEALNLLQAQQVDLVVTDMQMPMMDGLVLLAFMLENCPETPCIIMSAYGNPELKEQLRPDILHFIDKPIDPDRLARTIRAAISGPRNRKSGKKTISMADLMNVILIGKKTCVFRLKSKEGGIGLCYFHGGDFYNAIYGNIQGEEAFKKMLEWPEAEIRFMKSPKSRGEKKISSTMPEMIRLAGSSNLTIKGEKKKPT